MSSGIYPRRIRQTLIRLDETVMLTIPGEMFTELALDFKARARQMGIATSVILGLGASLIDAGLENLGRLQSQV